MCAKARITSPPFRRPTIELSERRELGNFLLSKRRALDPKALGLQPRRRRAPGVSREEVAYLAGISADWYGRLEGGRESNPSRSTLAAIAKVLRLTDAETSFAYSLVGLADPRVETVADDVRSEVLKRLVLDPSHLAISVTDAYLTPVTWNAIADAWWQLSGLSTPAERNFIARMEDPHLVALTAENYEPIARQLVGVFRIAHTKAPTPFSQHILDGAMKKPLFRRFWEEHTVADLAWESSGPHARKHSLVGEVCINTLQLSAPRTSDIIGVIAPADDASREKFARLRELGRDSGSLRELALR